jgi:glycogen debranching enzyme
LFSEQIFKAGLGSVSEVFDGEAPYTPGGCIAQAWSVAEPLRAYVEDIQYKRPSYEKKYLLNEVSI